jgi:hypothetical protein
LIRRASIPMWKSVFLREKVTCREQVVTAPTLCANGENEAMTKRGAAITLPPKSAHATSASSQSVNSMSLSWRGCSERSNGSLTMSGRSSDRVHIAEQAIEQIQETLRVIMGIACRTRPKGFEQAFALRWCDLLHALHPCLSSRTTAGVQNPGSKVPTCA